MAWKYIIPIFLFVTVTGLYYCFYHYDLNHNHQKHKFGQVLVHSSTAKIAAYEDNDVKECMHFLSTADDNGSNQVWQKVEPYSTWHVFSAYLDQRPDIPLVRIMAMAQNQTKLSLLCHMQMDGGKIIRVYARQHELWIHTWDSAKPGQYYHPFLLSCPVPKDYGHLKAVSVSTNHCTSQMHWIQVPPSHNVPSGSFAVCLKPLNFKMIDISWRLLEWLELQILLGADIIFTYVHQVHPDTWKVLQHYANLGRLVVKNYTLLDEKKGSTLWQKRRYEMTVYNDCFYRHLTSHKFVVNLDLDEAIVPINANSWHELLNNSHPPSASLAARCAYFFDSLGEDPSIPKHMHMLRHVYRSSELAPPGFAQKSFFLTKYAEEVSNHYALRAVRSDVRLLSGLKVNEARLHHYRKDCPELMEQDCDENYMKYWERDTVLWKYKDKLMQNVMQTMHKLNLKPKNPLPIISIS